MSLLSVLIVINNEEKQIEACLETVNFANEIVVILDKCNDNSEKIAKKYTSKLYKGNWNIEGDRRNYGIKKCKGPWVLEIDADERVSMELKKEIIETITRSSADWHQIQVKNYLGKRVVKYGWGAYFGKSAYAGLFKNKMKKWGNQRVHPKIDLFGVQGNTLVNKLDHFYCKNIADLFVKLNSYSNSRAIDLEKSNHNETLLRNIRRLFSRFWKCFFLRKGYKEKRIGFTIALVAAIYPLLSFLKYRKLK